MNWLKRLTKDLLGQRDESMTQEQNERAERHLQNVLTWSCHVCGEIRPDNKISVHKTFAGEPDTPFQINTRYCNDRDKCKNGAADVGAKMA